MKPFFKKMLDFMRMDYLDGNDEYLNGIEDAEDGYAKFLCPGDSVLLPVKDGYTEYSIARSFEHLGVRYVVMFEKEYTREEGFSYRVAREDTVLEDTTHIFCTEFGVGALVHYPVHNASEHLNDCMSYVVTQSFDTIQEALGCKVLESIWIHESPETVHFNDYGLLRVRGYEDVTFEFEKGDRVCATVPLMQEESELRFYGNVVCSFFGVNGSEKTVVAFNAYPNAPSLVVYSSDACSKVVRKC